MRTKSIQSMSARFLVRKLNSDAFEVLRRNVIIDLIRNINDPEHPLSLEELHVLEQSHVAVDNERAEVKILFTPTIPVSSHFVFNSTSNKHLQF